MMVEETNRKNKTIAVLTVISGLIVCVCVFLLCDRGGELAEVARHQGSRMEMTDPKEGDGGGLDSNGTPESASGAQRIARADGEVRAGHELPLAETDIEYIEAVIEVPSHPWHRKITDQIEVEDVRETIANFGEFYDNMLAGSSILGPISSPMCAEFKALQVTRARARIRKILALGRERPDVVVPELRSIFEEALKMWPAAVREFWERRDAGKRGGREMTKYDEYIGQAVGATYLLAELGDYDSLSQMLRFYKLYKFPTAGESIREYGPVPPGLTLCAMNRLVESFPEDRLGSEARQARDRYLEMAKDLKPSTEITVTQSWQADYAEHDPRFEIKDPERRALMREPTMKMTVYTPKFNNGQPISQDDGYVLEKDRPLFAAMEEFVKAAFPGEDFTLQKSE